MKRLCRLEESPEAWSETRRLHRANGTDFWCEIFQAGFNQVTLTSLIFPASVAIYAIET